MNEASRTPAPQFEALARDIERQLKKEIRAVIAAAETDARLIITQARADARRRVCNAIEDLRREGANRLAGAKAQLETEFRGRAQRRAAQAVSDGLPLLRAELDARWRDAPSRRQWTDALARLATLRLRPGAWCVEHPADWSESERRGFVAMIGKKDGLDISFTADSEIKSGLRIKADQALLDATPKGLLADGRTVAAMILAEIEEG